MRAIIEVDVPDYQIGQEVSIYFKDTMMIKGIVQEPKTGHWTKDIDDERHWDKVRFVCSECGKWQTYGESDFCPKCGSFNGGDINVNE